MNRAIATLVFSGVMICGAQAFADDTSSANSNNSPTLTNSQAIHKKLMKDCLDQQKAQNSGGSASDARKACQSQVKTQMEQMNNAGTVPPSSVPPKSSEGTTSSGTASTDAQD